MKYDDLPETKLTTIAPKVFMLANPRSFPFRPLYLTGASGSFQGVYGFYGSHNSRLYPCTLGWPVEPSSHHQDVCIFCYWTPTSLYLPLVVPYMSRKCVTCNPLLIDLPLLTILVKEHVAWSHLESPGEGTEFKRWGFFEWLPSYGETFGVTLLQ